ALSNLAYGCLLNGQYGEGLRASKEAVELLECVGTADPSEANLTFNLAPFLVALAIHARLLLRVAMVDEANRVLRRAADLSGRTTAFTHVPPVVAITCALLDTYTGNFDRGVARLVDFALSRETQNPVLVADALRDLAEAHVAANRPEMAGEHLQELA